MNNDNLQKMLDEAFAIEVADAKAEGKIGYMARVLVQATMPHSEIKGGSFQRINGAFQLNMLSPPDVGLPYGSIPRILMAWISTEAMKTKSPQLFLGNSLSKFMEQLDLVPTGGRWGSITRLKEQTKRLLACAISCTYNDGEQWAIKHMTPISQATLWWNPKNPQQTDIFTSTLTLGTEFFEELIQNPVPVHMDVLKGLKKSPLALDIYCWLTHRMSYLRQRTLIPWQLLQMQFGGNYENTPQGVRNFKKAFLRELRKVNIFYPIPNMEDGGGSGFILKPGKTHILRLK